MRMKNYLSKTKPNVSWERDRNVKRKLNSQVNSVSFHKKSGASVPVMRMNRSNSNSKQLTSTPDLKKKKKQMMMMMGCDSLKRSNSLPMKENYLTNKSNCNLQKRIEEINDKFLKASLLSSMEERNWKKKEMMRDVSVEESKLTDDKLKNLCFSNENIRGDDNLRKCKKFIDYSSIMPIELTSPRSFNLQPEDIPNIKKFNSSPIISNAFTNISMDETLTEKQLIESLIRQTRKFREKYEEQLREFSETFLKKNKKPIRLMPNVTREELMNYEDLLQKFLKDLKSYHRLMENDERKYEPIHSEQENYPLNDVLPTESKRQLENRLKQLEEQCQKWKKSENDLQQQHLRQNTSQTAQINRLKASNSSLQKKAKDLETKLSAFESCNEEKRTVVERFSKLKNAARMHKNRAVELEERLKETSNQSSNANNESDILRKENEVFHRLIDGSFINTNQITELLTNKDKCVERGKLKANLSTKLIENDVQLQMLKRENVSLRNEINEMKHSTNDQLNNELDNTYREIDVLKDEIEMLKLSELKRTTNDSYRKFDRYPPIDIEQNEIRKLNKKNENLSNEIEELNGINMEYRHEMKQMLNEINHLKQEKNENDYLFDKDSPQTKDQQTSYRNRTPLSSNRHSKRSGRSENQEYSHRSNYQQRLNEDATLYVDEINRNRVAQLQFELDKLQMTLNKEKELQRTSIDKLEDERLDYLKKVQQLTSENSSYKNYINQIRRSYESLFDFADFDDDAISDDLINYSNTIH
ncbi:hypothetical protein SNEBB_008903 [Seison nebaliae]|nr:hypothetical protein SNEBB_008903 [Seison nebaliae]